MTKAVFDAVGYARSLINPRSRWGRLMFDHADRYELVMSVPLVKEVIDLLTRHRVRKKFDKVEGRDLATVLGIIGRGD